MLDDLLICPVCHAELQLDQIRQYGIAACSECKYEYRYANGVFDLLPRPFPDTKIQRAADLWDKVQDNGLISYTQEPESNLSVGERQDARMFGQFCELDGTVLDIGCGPQAFPSYAAGFKGWFIGIDPLRGLLPRNFDFVVAIGEYLPFRDSKFDHVVFATSLDHVISMEQVFEEVQRVLKPNGVVDIWFGVPHKPNKLGGFANKAINTGRYILRGDLQGLLRRIQQEVSEPAPNKPEWLNQLSVPEGAVDTYHLAHLDQTVLEVRLLASGFKIIRSTAHPEIQSHFMKAVIR